MNLSLLLHRFNSVRRARAALWACACGVFAALASFAVAAQAVDSVSEARMWLGKIASSAETVSYEGTFIFRRDDQLVTMHVIHVANKDGERERLTSLSGAQREFIRSKEGVICLIPGKKHVTLNKGSLGRSFPNQLVGRMQDLEKNYRLVMGDADRIAGRMARMIVIEPKDNYRYGYRIWVDERTGLLLQSDLVNERGNAVEQFMFTSLKIASKVTAEMMRAVTMDKEMRRSLQSSKPETVTAADVQWQIMNMPSGFSLVERYQHSHAMRGPVDQLVLTDGMATVSVFVEHLGEHAKPFNGVSHVGAVNAYGAVVNDRQLTVVGEVPLATVRLIGGSLRLSVAGQ